MKRVFEIFEAGFDGLYLGISVLIGVALLMTSAPDSIRVLKGDLL